MFKDIIRGVEIDTLSGNCRVSGITLCVCNRCGTTRGCAVKNEASRLKREKIIQPALVQQGAKEALNSASLCEMNRRQSFIRSNLRYGLRSIVTVLLAPMSQYAIGTTGAVRCQLPGNVLPRWLIAELPDQIPCFDGNREPLDGVDSSTDCQNAAESSSRRHTRRRMEGGKRRFLTAAFNFHRMVHASQAPVRA